MPTKPTEPTAGRDILFGQPMVFTGGFAGWWLAMGTWSSFASHFQIGIAGSPVNHP